MFYNQYYNKKKIANLDLYQYNNNSVISPSKLSYNSEEFLGSIWFFSEKSVVPSYFGCADSSTGYYVGDHYKFYAEHAHLYVLRAEPYTQNGFPNMTSNNAPEPFSVGSNKTDASKDTCGRAFSSASSGNCGGYTVLSIYTDGLFKLKQFIPTVGWRAGGGFPGYFQVDGSLDAKTGTRIAYGDNLGALLPSSDYPSYLFTIQNWSFNSFYRYFRFSKSGDFLIIYNLVFITEKYQDKVNEFDNNIFGLKDLQYLAPPGFKTYIYIGT